MKRVLKKIKWINNGFKFLRQRKSETNKVEDKTNERLYSLASERFAEEIKNLERRIEFKKKHWLCYVDLEETKLNLMNIITAAEIQQEVREKSA